MILFLDQPKHQPSLFTQATKKIYSSFIRIASSFIVQKEQKSSDVNGLGQVPAKTKSLNRAPSIFKTGQKPKELINLQQANLASQNIEKGFNTYFPYEGIVSNYKIYSSYKGKSLYWEKKGKTSDSEFRLMKQRKKFISKRYASLLQKEEKLKTKKEVEFSLPHLNAKTQTQKKKKNSSKCIQDFQEQATKRKQLEQEEKQLNRILLLSDFKVDTDQVREKSDQQHVKSALSKQESQQKQKFFILLNSFSKDNHILQKDAQSRQAGIASLPILSEPGTNMNINSSNPKDEVKAFPEAQNPFLRKPSKNLDLNQIILNGSSQNFSTNPKSQLNTSQRTFQIPNNNIYVGPNFFREQEHPKYMYNQQQQPDSSHCPQIFDFSNRILDTQLPIKSQAYDKTVIQQQVTSFETLKKSFESNQSRKCTEVSFFFSTSNESQGLFNQNEQTSKKAKPGKRSKNPARLC